MVFATIFSILDPYFATKFRILSFTLLFTEGSMKGQKERLVHARALFVANVSHN